MAVLFQFFRPLLIITIFHFTYISFVVVPDIAREVGGLQPLDFYLQGYTFAEAMTFLATLNSTGGTAFAQFHASHDVIFPALYGLTLATAIWYLSQGLSQPVRIITILAPIAAALVDYSENIQMRGLINMDLEFITPEMIAEVSSLTEAKFLIIGISFGILGLILGRNYIANAPAVRY